MTKTYNIPNKIFTNNVCCFLVNPFNPLILRSTNNLVLRSINPLLYIFHSCKLIRVKSKQLLTKLYNLKNSEEKIQSIDDLQLLFTEIQSYQQQTNKYDNINMEQMNSLHYLDIHHWIFFIDKINIKYPQLLGQAGELDVMESNDVSEKITIEKEFEKNEAKSKKRRNSLPARFSFNTKNALNLANEDKRSPFQIFASIIQKLHQKYSPEEVDLLCKSCHQDLSVPQISKNGVFLGVPFIKALIKKYKRSPNLCYGNEAKIKKVFNEIGYSREDILHILNNDDDSKSEYDVIKRYKS